METFKEQISKKSFVGIIEENVDPDRKLRLKIRVPYFHGTKNQIPTDDLPWSLPKKRSSVSSEVPDINKIINVSFPTGEILYPEYDSVEHFDINLQNKIEDLDDSGYTKFISLCYNHNTQIFISTDDGLNLFHKKTGLQITDDGDIITRLNGNSSTYYIGDENSSQAAILGNNWIDFFDKLMKALPAAYLDSNGAPCTMTPNMVSVVQQYNLLKKDFTSKNVFISDNNSISSSDIETKKQTGDKYETINETDEINLVIEELEQEEKKEEQKKEEEKKQISAEKTDERINEDDGVLSDTAALENHVTESKNTVTENVILDEESSDEGTEMDENSYYADFYDSDNGGFTDDDSGSSTVSNTDESTGEDNYWDPEYFYPPPTPPSSAATGGSAVNGRRKGTKIKRRNINSNKENLDLSLLPATGMMSNFLTYDRCLHSNTADQMGVANDPDNNDHLNNLIKVSKNYWDITFKFFKEELDYILVLNSAYRNLAVNTRVGGAKHSQHKTGSALDLVLTKDGAAYPKNKRLNNLLFYYLKHRFSKYGQLIWEGNASDGPQWCHISLNNAGNERMIFPAVSGVIKEPNLDTVKILKKHGIWKDELEDKKYVV